MASSSIAEHYRQRMLALGEQPTTCPPTQSREHLVESQNASIASSGDKPGRGAGDEQLSSVLGRLQHGRSRQQRMLSGWEEASEDVVTELGRAASTIEAENIALHDRVRQQRLYAEGVEAELRTVREQLRVALGENHSMRRVVDSLRLELEEFKGAGGVRVRAAAPGRPVCVSPGGSVVRRLDGSTVEQPLFGVEPSVAPSHENCAMVPSRGSPAFAGNEGWTAVDHHYSPHPAQLVGSTLMYLSPAMSFGIQPHKCTNIVSGSKAPTNVVRCQHQTSTMEARMLPVADKRLASDGIVPANTVKEDVAAVFSRTPSASFGYAVSNVVAPSSGGVVRFVVSVSRRVGARGPSYGMAPSVAVGVALGEDAREVYLLGDDGFVYDGVPCRPTTSPRGFPPLASRSTTGDWGLSSTSDEQQSADSMSPPPRRAASPPQVQPRAAASRFDFSDPWPVGELLHSLRGGGAQPAVAICCTVDTVSGVVAWHVDGVRLGSDACTVGKDGLVSSSSVRCCVFLGGEASSDGLPHYTASIRHV